MKERSYLISVNGWTMVPWWYWFLGASGLMLSPKALEKTVRQMEILVSGSQEHQGMDSFGYIPSVHHLEPLLFLLSFTLSSLLQVGQHSKFLSKMIYIEGFVGQAILCHAAADAEATIHTHHLLYLLPIQYILHPQPACLLIQNV